MVVPSTHLAIHGTAMGHGTVVAVTQRDGRGMGRHEVDTTKSYTTAMGLPEG